MTYGPGKKSLLITGAYGIVGSNICKVLERDYPDIVVTKVRCDELDADFLSNKSLSGYDCLIFAAGYGQPQMFSKDKLHTIEINTDALSYFIKMVKPEGKVLYISSSEVYSGASSPHKETDIGTTTPQHSRACYIEGKRCGEAICMAYKEQGYDVKIARLALAYGPGTKKGDTRVINQFIESALVNKSIIMKDDGSAMRNYMYVEDAAQMILNILFKGSDTVYNVGGFSRISIRDLAHNIGRITDSAVMDGEKSKGDAPDDVSLDMTKYINEFGGSFTPMAEGIRKTIEYQKELYGIK